MNTGLHKQGNTVSRFGCSKCQFREIRLRTRVLVQLKNLNREEPIPPRATKEGRYKTFAIR